VGGGVVWSYYHVRTVCAMVGGYWLHMV